MGIGFRAFGFGRWALGLGLLLPPVIGCVSDASPSAGPAPAVDLADKHRGVSYEHAWGRRNRARGYGSEASGQSLTRLRDLGANWISVTPFAFQREAHDTSFRWGGRRVAETDERFRRVVAQARDREIKVMLKPHIWLRPPAWVGMVESRTEDDWTAWFSGYRDFILHYASLAQDANVEALCIGNELSGTSHREDDWRALIADVRAVYKGKLTYGAHVDEVEEVAFWDALDFIGVSAYFELARKPSSTRAELVAAWKPITIGLADLSMRWNRPVLFTEIGYRSVDFAAQSPWKFDDTSPVNLQLQADAYAAFFDAVWMEPWFAGAYWWKWRSSLDDGGPDDDDYTPRDKPAEQILREHYGGY